MRKKRQPGRVKPCANCGAGFWCVPSREAGSRHGETKYCGIACAHFVKANQDDVELFTRKVQRGLDDACWPFMGARVPSGGYGRAWLNGRLIAAHRIAYMLAKGNIPAGLDVMHTCDNPPCCNPRHLKAATTVENMRDCMAKGRAVFPGSKLDEPTARQILALKGIKRAQDTAEEFDVSLSCVHNIWTGRSWAELQEVAA